MHALIDPDGRVVQTASAAFPVPAPLHWADCPDGTTVGSRYDGSAYAAPAAPAAPDGYVSRALAARDIVGGFRSEALGAAHTYPSTEVDQRNLTAAVAAAAGAPDDWAARLWCRDAGGTWAFAAHTAPQLRRVGLDWLAFREGVQAQLIGAA